MQISCNHCGARYEFDATAIPAAGYDAQCTTCQQVFFVRPELPAPGNGQISVTCGHCGAIYQFAPSDIPAQGYDAQCTQCAHIFFVDRHGGAPQSQPAPGPSITAPDVPAPPSDLGVGAFDDRTEQQIVAPPRGFTPRALDAGTMELVPGDDLSGTGLLSSPELTPPMPTPIPDALRPKPAEWATTQPLDASSTAATSTGAAAPADEDFQTRTPTVPTMLPTNLSPDTSTADVLRAARPPWWQRAWPVVAVLAGLLFLLSTVQPALVKRGLVTARKLLHSTPPEVLALCGQAREQLLRDDEEGLVNARRYSEQALARDEEFADAYAIKALAHALRGADARVQGRAVLQSLQRRQALLRNMGQNLRSGLPTASQMEAMRRDVAEDLARSTKLLELGTAEMTEEEATLEHGEKVLGSSPTLQQARAVGLVANLEDNSKDIAKARESLSRSLHTRATADNEATAGAASPGLPTRNPWLHYAHALLRLHGGSDDDLARAAASLQQALIEAPKMMRARVAMGQVLLRQGKLDEARRVVGEVVTLRPTHARARLLMQQIATAKAASNASPAPATMMAPAFQAPAVRGPHEAKATAKRAARSRRPPKKH